MPNDGDAATIAKYSRLIHKISNRAARKARASTHGAEDFYVIGMEACLKAVACFDPVHGVAEAAWVARLVRQAVEREVVHAKARGFSGVLSAIRGQVVDPPAVVSLDDDPPAEPPLEHREAQIRWLQAKLDRLNPAERQVIQAALAGVSGTEIAAARGVSKQRVDQMKDAIVARLRRAARLTFHPV